MFCTYHGVRGGMFEFPNCNAFLSKKIALILKLCAPKHWHILLYVIWVFTICQSFMGIQYTNGVVGWFAVCDCGIFWSNSLFNINIQHALSWNLFSSMNKKQLYLAPRL